MRCTLAAAQSFVPGAMQRERTQQLDHATTSAVFHAVSTIAAAAAMRIGDSGRVRSYWDDAFALLGDVCSST